MDRFDDEIENLITEVIGALIEVHRHLGPGQKEVVYSRALAHELTLRGIPFEREHRFVVHFKDVEVGEGSIDFWIGKRLALELKVAKALDEANVSQVVFYLANKKEPVGLLANMNVPVMKSGIRRVIRTPFA